jgi:hypothetical protein
MTEEMTDAVANALSAEFQFSREDSDRIARVAVAAMTLLLGYPEPFAVGQRVRHSSQGMGTIVAIKSDGLHVEFDHTPGKVRGVFDAAWFRSCAPRGVTLQMVPKSNPKGLEHE